MLVIILSMLSSVPTCIPLNSICKGYMSRRLATLISIPVRCVNHVEARRTAASCMGGMYSKSVAIVGSSNIAVKRMPAHRANLLILMRHTLGYDNALERVFVRV